MKSRILVFFLVLLLFTPLGGQENKPIIRLNPFIIDGLGEEEGRSIESLILSYITDLGEIDDSRASDYTLSGSINIDQDYRVLALEILKADTGELFSYSYTYRTTSELALKARSAVVEAFASGGNRPPVPGDAGAEEIGYIRPEHLTIEGISGTWRGDEGIVVVRLERNGTGTAVFSSGATMRLVYTIEKNTLKVIQTSPNNERFYHPLPQGIARQLVSQAEPLRWELFLYDQGLSLRGSRIITAVEYAGDRILELVPGIAKDAEWIKSYR
ncbi:hypothetical protein FACS189468_8170 [Spirochaetia bacterium]|nr:hypothetical protein FACS189468_8170 [Spirochaetia bacterium]